MARVYASVNPNSKASKVDASHLTRVKWEKKGGGISEFGYIFNGYFFLYGSELYTNIGIAVVCKCLDGQLITYNLTIFIFHNFVE